MSTDLASPDSEEDRGLTGQIFGNYRIERRLGEGGMGMVFAARHVNNGGRAAVKLLRENVASRQDIVARLFNEASAATAVEHPGIVRIFDSGYSPEGVAYLTMEFLPGESLGKRLERVERMPIEDALRIARQVASALRAAHAEGVIHRDLKPDNVMLVPDADVPFGERAKVLDFGIAKVAEQNRVHTHTGMVMGTPVYMSPEQCRSAKNVTDRADVYSLGIILYKMIAGRPPFDAKSLGDIIAMHLNDVPMPLVQVVPEATYEVSRLVLSMLEKVPSMRPSMDEVVSDLSQQIGSADSLRSHSGLTAVGAASTVSDLPTQPLSVSVLRSMQSPGGLPLPQQLPRQLATPQAPTARAPVILLASLQRRTRQMKTWVRVRSRMSMARTGVALLCLSCVLAAGAWAFLRSKAEAHAEPIVQSVEQTATGPSLPLASAQPPVTEPKEQEQAAPKLVAGPQANKKTRKAVKPKPASEPTSLAEQKFIEGDYFESLRLARDYRLLNPKEGWTIIGKSACHLHNLDLAETAIRTLYLIPAPDTEYWIDIIYAECRKIGYSVSFGRLVRSQR